MSAHALSLKVIDKLYLLLGKHQFKDVIKMNEDEIRAKLKKETEKEREKEERILEEDKKLKEIIQSIKEEIEKWKNVLPVDLEVVDEIPVADINKRQYFLFKKQKNQKISVVWYEQKSERGRIKKVQNERSIEDFMEYLESWGAEPVLLKLKDRIPVFIEYLSTKIQ